MFRKEKSKSLILLTVISIISACSTPMEPTNKVLNESLSFSSKAQIQNSIAYSGYWSTLSDANAGGGNYNQTSKDIDSSDSSLVYSPDWINDTGNGASTDAMGGSYKFNLNNPAVLAVNTDTNVKYSTLHTWNSSTYNNEGFTFSDGIFDGKSIESVPEKVTTSSTVQGDAALGWIFQGGPTYNFYSHPGNDTSSFYEISFTGTNVILRGFKTNVQGIVNIKVFDSSNVLVRDMPNVDLYAPTSPNVASPETVAEIRGLPHGTYKVRVQATNTKNPSSGGTRFDFVRGIVFPSFQYQFTGTSIRYHAFSYNRGGWANVIIDNKPPVIVNLYSTGLSYLVKEFAGLAPGPHTITVEGSLFTNSPGGYSVISLSKFSVAPSVSGQFRGNGMEVSVVKHPYYGMMNLYVDGQFKKEIDLYSPSSFFEKIYVSASTNKMHSFVLTGSDSKNTNAQNKFLNFDGIYLNTTSSASYQFNGTGITYIATKKPDQGKVDVYVDDILKGTYNLYSATPQYQQAIYSVTGLAAGTHNIEIVQKPYNEKDPASTGNGINLDIFDVPDNVGTGGIGGTVGN